MRAAVQAHPSPAREHTARHLLLNLSVAIFATVALLWVWRPTVVHAQVAPKDSVRKAAPAAATASKQPPKSSARSRKAPRDTTTTAHVVSAGETLWSIATRYYGDGHQWRAIARRNGIATNGETAIEVGKTLQVPARSAVFASAAVRPAVADTTVPKAAMAPAAPPAARPTPTPGLVPPKREGRLASQASAKGDAKAGAKTDATVDSKGDAKSVAAAVPTQPKGTIKSEGAAATSPGDAQMIAARAALRPTVKAERILTRGPARIGLLSDGDLKASRSKSEGTTVFTHVVPNEAEAVAAVRAVTRKAAPAPRRGEYVAAPFAMAVSKWSQGARILGRVDASSASPAAADVRLQFGDDVEVAPSPGKSLTVGEQLVAVRAGPMLPNGSQVAIPGGVLQITRVAGGKTFGRVHSLNGAIDQSYVLVPIDGSAAPAESRVEAVSGQDVRSTITWIEDGAVLPTLQSYVLLSATEGQGVRAGDHFAVVVKPATGPEERTAVVRIVRTSPLGSTGIVVRQSGSDIAVGSMARRIARVP